MDIRDLQTMIVDWADSLLPGRSARKASIKLAEEAIELLDAIDDNNGGEAEEIADVIILILDIAHLRGVDVVEAVISKLDVNKARKWEINKGILRHVK